MSKMTSLERVLTTLSHKEPDRVPLFLLMNTQGAKYHGMTHKEYYSNPQAVAEAQLHFQKEYDNDIVHSFYYAGVEIEAFGGDVVFRDDRPVNAGAPFIKAFSDIDTLSKPNLKEVKVIQNVLQTTKLLADAVGGKVLVAGVVMSPYSLPIMQLGFENYLILKNQHEERFNKLMKINTEFCVEYANMLLEAGANSIVYFDPVSSQTISSYKEFTEVGKPIMNEVIERVNGPIVVHYASGLIERNLEDILVSGAAAIGTSSKEDHVMLKERTKGKISIIGNLNGIDMVNWTESDIEKHVKEIIGIAGKGGGFILCDNHGEIPLQVPSSVLKGISKAVKKYGTYPIEF